MICPGSDRAPSVLTFRGAVYTFVWARLGHCVLEAAFFCQAIDTSPLHGADVEFTVECKAFELIHVIAWRIGVEETRIPIETKIISRLFECMVGGTVMRHRTELCIRGTTP